MAGLQIHFKVFGGAQGTGLLTAGGYTEAVNRGAPNSSTDSLPSACMFE